MQNRFAYAKHMTKRDLHRRRTASNISSPGEVGAGAAEGTDIILAWKIEVSTVILPAKIQG